LLWHLNSLLPKQIQNISFGIRQGRV